MRTLWMIICTLFIVSNWRLPTTECTYLPTYGWSVVYICMFTVMFQFLSASVRYLLLASQVSRCLVRGV